MLPASIGIYVAWISCCLCLEKSVQLEKIHVAKSERWPPSCILKADAMSSEQKSKLM